MIEIDTQGKPFNFNALPSRDYTEHRQALINAFCAVRLHTEQISSQFSPEDQQLQSMPDASPVKWHLAHTTWFFETFILAVYAPSFKWFDENFRYLFNSYYNAIGAQYPRPHRGLMSRPGLERVLQYRERVTQQMLDLLGGCDDGLFGKLSAGLVLGLNHEQQHQELIFTDISHALLYQDGMPDEPVSGQAASEQPIENKSAMKLWLDFEGGETITGYQGQGFCFDNELAAHSVLLLPFQIACQPVSNSEWVEFIDEGGYKDPLLWLSDGWAWMCENNIRSPFYWYEAGGDWYHRTLAGTEPVPPAEPVSHVSYYEADAFACWKKARLPREGEWEHACSENTLLSLGRNWEWSQSAYSAYPGFKATAGDASEYNGKFMVSQMVLRGASQATAPFHSRPSYRNFFYPGARWQFSSVRLANDPV